MRKGRKKVISSYTSGELANDAVFPLYVLKLEFMNDMLLGSTLVGLLSGILMIVLASVILKKNNE